MQPVLSLIVPLFIRNGADQSEALTLLAKRREPQIEIISIPVCDPNATENDQLYAPTIGEARNKGVELARGQYVAFGDDDPNMLGDFIDRSLKATAQNDFDMALPRTSSATAVADNGRIVLQSAQRDLGDTSDMLFQLASSSPKYKLFKRSLIEATGISFLPTNCEAAPLFTYGNLAEAKAIRLLNPPETQPEIHQPSFSNTLDTNKCLIESIERLHSFLQGNQKLPLLLRTYQEAGIRLIYDHLKNLRDDNVRCSILDEMLQNNYLTTCQLDRKALEDPSDAVISRANTIENALHQRIHEISVEEESSYETILVRQIDEEPLVSIVVPVYNAMPYLTETIASLTSQTLTSLEIICINDGSTDQSLAELCRIAEEDERITIISQQNRGLSATRNIGLERARGRYCYFMDSDDILEKDALRTLVDKMEKDSLDLLCFDARPIYENEELKKEFPGFMHSYDRHKCYDDAKSGPEMLRQLEVDGTYFQSACLYISRRSYLESINARFIEGIAHEDNAFTFDCFLRAKRISHINHAFFHRRVRPGSIMTSTVRFTRPYGYFVCFDAMMNSFVEMKATLPPETRASIQRIIFSVLKSARSAYEKMTPEDHGRELGLEYFYQPFTIAVIQPGELSIELSKSRAKAKKARDELKKVRRSRTFRLGKVLIAPLTALKKMAKGQLETSD